MLQVTDTCEILFEPAPVARAEVALEILGLLPDDVEDAAPAVEVADLRLHLLGSALEEKLVEHLGGALLWRDGDTGSRPRETAPAAVDRERERRETRADADALGDILVERDAIAERAARRVRRGREERDVGRMAAVHIRMGDAAEHREILAVVLQVLEIGRQRVVEAGVRREEEIGPQAEVVADAKQAARLGTRGERRRCGRGPCEGRKHSVQERQ